MVQVKGIEKHLEAFKEYLHNNNEDWEVAHLKIFRWASGSFSIEDSYVNRNGESSKLKVRGTKKDNIAESLQDLKILLEKKGFSKWNNFRYTFQREGTIEYDIL